jgi:hypothetical protein
MTFIANRDKISQTWKLLRCNVEKVVYDISFIMHFVALTHS